MTTELIKHYVKCSVKHLEVLELLSLQRILLYWMISQVFSDKLCDLVWPRAIGLYFPPLDFHDQKKKPR